MAALKFGISRKLFVVSAAFSSPIVVMPPDMN